MYRLKEELTKENRCDIIYGLATQIADLLEAQCQNSGINWLEDFMQTYFEVV